MSRFLLFFLACLNVVLVFNVDIDLSQWLTSSMNFPEIPFENEFWVLGCQYIHHDPNRPTAKSVGMGRFKSVFGISPRGCAAVWDHIRQYITDGCKPVHLLFALVFLRHYLTESLNRIIFGGVDEKTFRQRCRMMIDHLSFDMNDVVRFFSA